MLLTDVGIRGQSVALSLGSSVGLQLLLTPGLFPLNDCTLTTDGYGSGQWAHFHI